MKRYPAYKDSGIQWIGEIPSLWRINKLKHTTYIKGRIGWQALTTNEYIAEGPYLVTGTDFLDGRINWENCFHVSQERYEMDPYIKLQNEDLLITKDGTIGKVAVTKDLTTHATLNSGVFLTRPFRTNTYSDEFMYWILVSDIFSRYIDYTSKGSTISHLYQEVFREFIYPTPSLDEQKVIADYLDLKTAQIDDLIAKKEQMIELLKEERTAIINQAVTKGLNPKAEMRDTGIEWLDKIPKHWKIKKLKYVADKVQTGITPPSESTEYYDDGNIDWYTPGDFQESSVQLRNSFRKINRLAIEKGVARIFPSHSVLLIGIGATLGKVGIIKKLSSSNQQINAITFSNKFNPFFGVYYLQAITDTVVSLSNASTLAILNQTQTKDILVLVPPLEEQGKIVEYIQSVELKHAEIVNREQKQIDLLKEYRTALISEVVTGKIDIRDEINA